MHCGSGEMILALDCDQGSVKVTLVSCFDSIVSEATYNATNSTDNLVCADSTSDTLMESVSFGVKGVFVNITTHMNTF